MTAARGMTNHLMVESFERVHKHLTQLGYSEHDAARGAAALTFALSGEYTREQAWKAANEITPKQNRPPE